jgi:hypothetical protein
MMYSLRQIFLFLIVTFLIIGCSTTSNLEPPPTMEETPSDNKYDSEFPDKAVSKELNFVSKTVKKLDCLVFYESHIFPPENSLDIDKLSDSLIRKVSVGKTVTNESVTGTAVVVYNDGNKIALLTCAHVVDFPDTLLTRYDDGKGAIETLSVKIRQQNYVKGLPEGEDIEILIKDDERDIAFLGKVLKESNLGQQVLNYPLGNTRDLEWGSIVYVMGYPLGNLMVTRAIVSNPTRSSKTRFLTDALYNRGISGSPVLAIRDGVPNFEWVGMATSSAAQRIYYVKPGKKDPEYINPEARYTDDLYVDHHRVINYGVTFNVTIEAITGLLRKNSHILIRKGYNPELFFK